MKRLATLLLAVVLALGLSLSVLTASGAPPTTTLDHGHVDAFYVTPDGEGGIDLRLKEDVTGNGVVHRPEDVLLRVSPAALVDIPEGFPGAPRAYFLPLTQNPDLLWPGWETTPAREAGVERVEFDVEVEGPGDVHLWSTGSLGETVSVLGDGGTRLPGTIVAPFPAHTHANWAFTEPGAYTFTVQAVGPTADGVLTSPTRTYAWEVGDVAEPTDAPSEEPAPEPEPTEEPTAEPSPSATPTTRPTTPPTPTASPTARPTSSPTATPTRAPSPDDRVLLDHGHVDAFHVIASDEGLDLRLREDVTGLGVSRDPATVLLGVRQAALTDVPAGLPGTPRAFVLPLTQDPDLLWPGWETSGVARHGFGRIDIQVRSVEGPGEVHVFSMDSLGAIASVLDDDGTELPGAIVAPFPAHTHANWVFTQPGTYTFEVRASGRRDGATVTSPTRTYTWRVGDAEPDPGETPSPTPSSTARPTAKPTPSARPTASPRATPTSTPSATPSDTGTAPKGTPSAPAVECRPVTVTTKGTGSSDIATSGHLDVGAQIQGGKLVPSTKDDRKSPPVWVDPTGIVMSIQDKKTAPSGMEFIAAQGADIWLIGATQDANTPWVGQNTMHETFIAETKGTLTWKLKSVDGPGKVAVFAAGAFGAGVGERMFDNVGGPTGYTIPANTHAHPNWVFNAPGHYKMTLTMSATLKSGAKVSADTTLHFAVGVDATQVAKDAGGSGSRTTVVGRTPDGEPCELKAGLPGTGGEVWLAPDALDVAPVESAPSSGGPVSVDAGGATIGLVLALLGAAAAGALPGMRRP